MRLHISTMGKVAIAYVLILIVILLSTTLFIYSDNEFFGPPFLVASFIGIAFGLVLCLYFATALVPTKKILKTKGAIRFLRIGLTIELLSIPTLIKGWDDMVTSTSVIRDFLLFINSPGIATSYVLGIGKVTNTDFTTSYSLSLVLTAFLTNVLLIILISSLLDRYLAGKNIKQKQ